MSWFHEMKPSQPAFASREVVCLVVSLNICPSKWAYFFLILGKVKLKGIENLNEVEFINVSCVLRI